MTKRHFEQFARLIKHQLCIAAILDTQDQREREEHACKIAAEFVCEVAAQDNHRFDRERFMLACGLEN